MSYSITIPCGCSVYVSCNPSTGLAHTRVIQAHGPACRMHRHTVGARLYLWEILPDPSHAAAAIWNDDLDSDSHRKQPR